MPKAASIQELLQSGAHFGHLTRRWNPKMKEFIFMQRNGIHIIDLKKTQNYLQEAIDEIQKLSRAGKTILFVGTKKQAQDAISSEAARCKMPYVNQRWLGGTLTNNITISNSVKKLKSFEEDQKLGLFDKLSKKEASRKTKKLSRLNHYLGGIKDMRYLPKILIIVDTKKEELAIKEAKKLGIKVIGLVDTNGDPSDLDFPIPGNDDAIRAIKLICSVFANAVIEGTEAGVEEGETEDNIKIAKERYDESFEGE